MKTFELILAISIIIALIADSFIGGDQIHIVGMFLSLFGGGWFAGSTIANYLKGKK